MRAILIICLLTSTIFGRPLQGQPVREDLVFQISFEPIYDIHTPSVDVAGAGEGDFVAVWVAEPPWPMVRAVFARRYDSSGIPLGDPFQVNATGSPFGVVVANGPAEGFVVVWTTGGGGVHVVARLYDDGGTPQSDEIEVAVRNFETPRGIAVARDAAGGFVVVWVGDDPSATRLFARFYDPFGAPRGEPFQVNLTPGRQLYPVVALAGGGVFWIAWEYSSSEIFARRFTTGGEPLEGETRIDSSTTGRQQEPAVFCDSAGECLFVWNQAGELYARRYDSSGRPNGAGFRLGSSRGVPAVAGGAAGDFLVLSRSRPRVLGQHFSPSGTPESGLFHIDLSASSSLRSPPAVTVDAVATFTVVYAEQVANDRAHVFGRRLPPEARAGTFHVDIARDVIEDDTTVPVTIHRTGGSRSEVSVEYLTVDASATADEDYTPVSGTLTFADSDDTTFRRVEVPILDDDIFEGDETLRFTLADPGGGAFLIPPAATEITILDDDVQPPAPGPEPLGPTFRPGDDPAADRRAPALAAGEAGFVIVWEGRDAEGTVLGVFARSYDPEGVPRGGAFHVAEGSEPAVAVDAAGDFIVAWTGGTESGRAIRARRFDPWGTAVGPELEVATSFFDDSLERHHSVHSPRVVRLLGGVDLVAWFEIVEGSASYSDFVQAQLLDDQGLPVGVPFGLVGPLGPFPRAATYALAADRQDRLVVVSANGAEGLFARRYTAGGEPLGPLFRVDAGTADFIGSRPAVAVDEAGGFVIAWEEDVPQVVATDINARFYAPDGTPRGDPLRVNRPPSVRRFRPSVTIDAASRSTVVWQSLDQDGDGMGVFGQQLDAASRKVGGEFLVPDVTRNHQRNPVVASDPQGQLVIAWENQEDDGSLDVLARRFAPTTCRPDEETLCLGGERFAVEAAWRDFTGRTGRGHAGDLTADTGTFWFFGESNVELAVKVLDGTALNGHFWVYYASLSNVEYTVTVTDTYTGAVREYFNPMGRFASAGDILAFPADPAPAGVSYGPEKDGTSDETVLPLHDGRFEIEAEWRDFAGRQGAGRALPLTRDTGCFWFFGDANVELVIKVLDGTTLNGHFWVFYASLSNVEYTITVTDTATGAVKVYHNPLGDFGSSGDIVALPQ